MHVAKFPKCVLLFLQVAVSLGWAMNKQPSKETLRDKVKGIFGLGTARPPSKQSESKPSEFIITTDIIKVCRSEVHTLTTHLHFSPHHALHHVIFFRSSTQTVV